MLDHTDRTAPREDLYGLVHVPQWEPYDLYDVA